MNILSNVEMRVMGEGKRSKSYEVDVFILDLSGDHEYFGWTKEED